MPAHEVNTRPHVSNLPLRLGACAFVLLLLGGLLACSAPGQSSGGSAKPPTYAAPSPVDIATTTDPKLASAAVVTPAGGSVSATGADGTKFTLTFPKGAVRGSEKITLTPVAVAAGLPFSGGLAGAVQMEPEGLRLLQPAVLRIESPKTTAAKGFEIVAFAYHKDGEGLYLSPSDSKDGALTLEIWHFSGAGAAQGTPQEISTQRTQHVPSSAEDAFAQRVQEYVGREKQAQLTPGQEPDPAFEGQMLDFQREAYDRFVGPELPTALQDCSKAPAIMSKALGWAKQVQLMVKGDSPRAQELQKLADGVIDTHEKVKKKCWQGYTATGSFGEGAFSGSVPSLEKPFTLTITAPGAATELKFSPSGPEAGSFTINGHAAAGAVFTGKGAYTVKDAGTESPTIMTSDAGTTRAPGMGFSWGHNVPIKLVPME